MSDKPKDKAERACYTQDELYELMKQGRHKEIDDSRINAMICLLPGRYYASMFFFTLPHSVNPPHGGDCSASLWCREDDPNTWFIKWRMRYYAGPDVWDGKDRRRYYGATLKGSKEEALDKARSIFTILAAVGGNELHEFVLDGDEAKVSRLIMDETKRPFWMHTSQPYRTPKDDPRPFSQIEKEVNEREAERERREKN